MSVTDVEEMPRPACNLETGDLVGIVDDNGCELDTLGIYIGLVIPAEIDLDVSDIIDDLQFIDRRFRTDSASPKRGSQLFYAVPEHWHHVLLVGDRILHLNAGFYTVTKREE